MCCTSLLKIIIFILLLFLIGCSSSQQQFQNTDITKELSPLKVNISEEVFDGENLYLRVKLDVFAIWDASCISFTIDSLKNGKIIDNHEFLLKDIIGKESLIDGVIYPGSYVFDLTSPLNGGSDYRLKVNWKVEEPKENDNDNIGIDNLRTKNISDCNEEECSELLRIEAELINNTKEPLSDIVTELIFTNKDRHSFTQKFPLEGVILYPDQRQNIQLDVDLSEDSELKECEFNLRIDSFQ